MQNAQAIRPSRVYRAVRLNLATRRNLDDSRFQWIFPPAWTITELLTGEQKGAERYDNPCQGGINAARETTVDQFMEQVGTISAVDVQALLFLLVFASGNRE